MRFENDWTVLFDADREKAIYYAERAVALDADLTIRAVGGGAGVAIPPNARIPRSAVASVTGS